ncbi:MAG: arsenite methyltransferase [Phycisphaerales bacterium]|nr:arsenite methyltransferase [Phycisphaerales bacterium]
MAEGWAKSLHGDSIRACSAGTRPQGLNPLAVRAMAEAGVDISRHASTHVDALREVQFDLVITVCSDAHESCPVFPGATNVIHVAFDDPPRLAREAQSDEAALPHYRRVRDEIREFVLDLPQYLHHERWPMKEDSTRSCCSDSCCGGAVPNSVVETSVAANELRDQVREGYGRIAVAGACDTGGGCCGPIDFTPDQLAQALGYSGGELAGAPDGANLGLSCGNPTALASLRSGEVVLDLGAGAGFDCFIAGPKVGASGRVIGVDMTPDMLSRARRNVADYRQRTGLDNVEFRLGEIEALPVADASVDVVISNCVLNLSPDKPRVWREIARVLKPGGRVAVSDLALLRPLPDGILCDIQALIGCVAGAVLIDDTRAMAEAAGLTEILLSTKPQYIEAMTDWQDPLYRKVIEALPAGSKASDYITSLDVAARRPHRIA